MELLVLMVHETLMNYFLFRALNHKKGHAKRKIFAVDMVADMVSQPNASVKFAVAMGYGGDV